MGTSRELAIGPVAVVSLLISAMVSKVINPVVDPVSYTKLVFTVAFFTGAFQALFGLFRQGFIDLIHCFKIKTVFQYQSILLVIYCVFNW